MNKQIYYFHSPPKRGKKRHTVAGILTSNKLSLGIASCAIQDQFIKDKGRKIAITRANEAQLGTLTLGRKTNVGAAFRTIAIGIINSFAELD